jgi:putative DNA primase/helicase
MTGNISNLFGGPFVPPSDYVEPVETQLAYAMRSAGIDPPPDLKIDGQLHRFSTKGRARDDSGWYVIFPDEPSAGRFGCWRDGIDVPFKAKVSRELTAAEQMVQTRRLSEASQRRKEERERKAAVAADTVAKIWSDAGAASPGHPYLHRKGIQPHGARVTGDGRIMVPLYKPDGALASLQYITDDGDKQYHPGGKAGGCYWIIGDVDKTLFVAEGFATAATILEEAGQAVAIAYSAHNIPATVGALRERYGPTQDIVVVADNDESGTGRAHAEQAIAKHGGRVVMPPTAGDANDYNLAGHDLHALLYPKAINWLTRAKDFSKEPAPIKWLVKRWVQDQALIMVHGPSGGGKTFVVLDWCLRIGSGVDEWQGHKVRHGEVVYLAGEGHHGLRGRVAAWRQHHGVDDPAVYLSSSGCDLNKADGYQKTLDAIRSLAEPPRLIVVDTLHRFMHGDENSAQDAKTMLDACAALMGEFRCSVLLVHHTGVSEEAQHRARGSSAWRGALENEISITPGKKDGDSITVTQRKAKDSETAEPLFVDLHPVTIDGWTDEDGEAVTSAVIVEGANPPEAPKKQTKVDKMRHEFQRAWFESGAELAPDHNPYLTRSALEAWLEGQRYAASQIRQMLKPSAEGKMINVLQTALQIEPNGAGWTVIDQVWSNAMRVLRSEK